jgi:uncharacterized protein
VSELRQACQRSALNAKAEVLGITIRVRSRRSMSKLLHFYPCQLEIPAKQMDEARFLVIGQVGGKHWSAVVTYRGDVVRLISVRRARKEEIALYESL